MLSPPGTPRASDENQSFGEFRLNPPPFEPIGLHVGGEMTLNKSNEEGGTESGCTADVAKGAALGASSGAAAAFVSGPVGVGAAAIIGAITGATTSFVASDA